MSKHRGPRISRRTAARVLRGAPVVVPGSLAALLAAAAAPPRDGELAGEQEAVTAFLEAAHRTTAPRPRSPSMIRTTLAKLLTVKVAAAAAALCTVGGVATAAVTGHLAMPSSHSSVTATTSSHAAAASGTHTEMSASHGSSSGHRGSPSPSLVGLCHAYLAGAGSDHGKALDNPAFTVLITKAGGRTNVDSYCAALLKEQPSATHASGAPTSPGRSADHPGGTDHPTGAPQTHPTGAPSTHPTGAPDTHPNGAPPNHN